MASGKATSMMSCWPGSMSEISGSMPEESVIEVLGCALAGVMRMYLLLLTTVAMR